MSKKKMYTSNQTVRKTTILDARTESSHYMI